MASLDEDVVQELVSAPIEVNSVATPSQVNRIAQALHAHYVSRNHAFDVNRHLLAFALACAHQGSSRETLFAGENQGISFRRTAKRVKVVCTVR